MAIPPQKLNLELGKQEQGSLVSLANLEKSIWKNTRDNSNSKCKLTWFTLIFK